MKENLLKTVLVMLFVATNSPHIYGAVVVKIPISKSVLITKMDQLDELAKNDIVQVISDEREVVGTGKVVKVKRKRAIIKVDSSVKKKSKIGFVVSALPELQEIQTPEEDNNLTLDFKVTYESRYFFEDRENSRRTSDTVSAESNFVYSIEDDNAYVGVKLFGRYDPLDESRSHFDVREAKFVATSASSELTIGVDKVFWGVLESAHFVDVVNQIDMVEDLRGDEKLGQPMISFRRFSRAGTFSLYVLPYFRRRTFHGPTGRPSLGSSIKVEEAQFESEAKDKHVDWAAYYQSSLGGLEISTSYFNGNAREPFFISKGEGFDVIPYYPLMQQFGIEIHSQWGPVLFKSEVAHRVFRTDDYTAAGGGIELTYNGVSNSSIDLGWVMEYLYDSREQVSIFDEVVFLGLRVMGNGHYAPHLLAGSYINTEVKNRVYTAEMSMRLFSNFTLTLISQIFESTQKKDPIYSIRNEDYVELEAAVYF